MGAALAGAIVPRLHRSMLDISHAAAVRPRLFNSGPSGLLCAITHDAAYGSIREPITKSLSRRAAAKCTTINTRRIL